MLHLVDAAGLVLLLLLLLLLPLLVVVLKWDTVLLVHVQINLFLHAEADTMFLWFLRSFHLYNKIYCTL